MANEHIDVAMAEDRPAKRSVRAWWVDAFKRRADEAIARGDVVFLTLPGRDGHDIQLLKDEGLLPVTEAGPLEMTDPPLVVAFEKRTMTAVALRQRHPGLTVRDHDIFDVVGGGGATAYPTSAEFKRFARAAVINLDLTTPWAAATVGITPLLEIIAKLATLHEPRGDQIAANWTLCLTLNARILGEHKDRVAEVKFVLDQTSADPDLKQLVNNSVGDDLMAQLQLDTSNLETYQSEVAQRLLRLVVPLRVIQHVSVRGWKVNCGRSAFYGGVDKEAAMVTFLLDFEYDQSSLATPVESISHARRSLLSALCKIDEAGVVTDG